jgi:hypothetical protein
MAGGWSPGHRSSGLRTGSNRLWLWSMSSVWRAWPTSANPVRRHILAFADRYGPLTLPPGGCHAGTAASWLWALASINRWWRLGQWLAHCRRRLRDGQACDRQVLLVAHTRAPTAEPPSLQVLRAARVLRTEMSPNGLETGPERAGAALLAVLSDELARRLDLGFQARPHSHLLGS